MSNSSKSADANLRRDDRLVCFVCAEDVHDEFMSLVLAGKEWSCRVCGCDRVVAGRFYEEDFGKKAHVLRRASRERRARLQQLTERARIDGQAAAQRGPLTGGDIADALEAALKSFDLRRTADADTYLATFFDALRREGVDVDLPLAAAGLALCWWCRRPVAEMHDATASDHQ